MATRDPCQPFSLNGERKGEDDERHLWPHVREAIRILRPRFALLENVAGHRTLGFDRVLGDLAEDGMHVRWTSLRASDVGAAHPRERLFILVADPEGVGWEAGGMPSGVAQEVAKSGGHSGAYWGPYGPVVRRWERLTRRAPDPTEPGSIKLNAALPEWLMGLPAGWVTGVPGVSYRDQVKALGNGVVPQQAYAAFKFLLEMEVSGGTQ